MDPTQPEDHDEEFEIWNALYQKQTDLYRSVLKGKKDLKDENERLKRQMDVLADAHKTMSLSKQMSEKQVEDLKKGNSLVLCLIDGDGSIFLPGLLSIGHAGGIQAVERLKSGITNHIEALSNPPTGPVKIWLTIYCNLSGLRDTLVGGHHCSDKQYDAFIEGFNNGDPLFSIVDVGSVKEGADTKLKEALLVFASFPQIVKVYFGGLHDNGYATTISQLETEGHLDKLIFLRGYRKIASQLKDYRIPECTLPRVFIQRKLVSTSTQFNTPFPQPQTGPSLLQPQSQPQSNSPSPQPQSDPPASPAPVLEPAAPGSIKQKPPCYFHYLATCGYGDRCQFGHHYTLTPQGLVDLRRNAKKYPCSILLRGQHCPFGENCCMSHTCPRGPKCTYLKQGKCKHNKPEMHIAIPNQPPYRKHKSNKQSVDGASEATPSESGFNQ